MNDKTQQRVRALIRKRGPQTAADLAKALSVTHRRVARIMFDMRDAQRIDLTPLRGLGAHPVWALTIRS